MRRGLELLRGEGRRACSRALAAFAREWRAEPTLGSTHLQPAQPTTVGKRATLWMQDLVLDLADLDHRIATLPCRGVKGTTGTQASFLEIFDGDHAKVRELDRARHARRSASRTSIPVSGQTYTRKLDAQVLGVVAGIAVERDEVQRRHPHAAVGRRDRGAVRDASRSARRRWRTSATRCARERIASLARFVVIARAEREPHARRAVLRAHARRQREPAARDSRERSSRPTRSSF